MAEYIPTPIDWVREQVELYESSGGKKGTTLRDTGLPCVLVTHTGNKTGAIRKTPLIFQMRVREVSDEQERSRLWELAVKAYPPYEDYQKKTSRKIPVFLAEPK